MAVKHVSYTSAIKQQALHNVSQRLPLEDIKVEQRFHRAVNDIVNGYGYSVESLGSGEYLIAKESTSLLEDNSVEYFVSVSECTCPDFATARAGLCKHRMAIMVVSEMNRLTAEGLLS